MYRTLTFAVCALALLAPACAEEDSGEAAALDESAITVRSNEANPLPKIRKLVYEAYGDEGDVREFLAGMDLVKEKNGGYVLRAPGATNEYPEKCSKDGKLKVTVTLGADGSWTRKYSAAADPAVSQDPECNGEKRITDEAGKPVRVEWQTIVGREAELRELLKECVFADVADDARRWDEARVDAMSKKVADAVSRNPRLRFARGIDFTAAYFALPCSVVLHDPVKNQVLAIQGDRLD